MIEKHTEHLHTRDSIHILCDQLGDKVKQTSALKRNLVIIIILVLSISIGFAYEYMWNQIERSTHPREYSEFVEKYSSEYGVPEYIVYSVIKTESSFKGDAVSHAGAIGLMQMMPETFEWLAQKRGESDNSGLLYDPETNIKYGTYFLSYLYAEYGNWNTVFAAYNCGMGKVNEWIAGNEYSDEYGNLTEIPIGETREYVKKVNKAIELYKKLYY